jgi:hypothetical protein
MLERMAYRNPRSLARRIGVAAALWAAVIVVVWAVASVAGCWWGSR